MLMVAGLVLPELGSSARIAEEPGPVVVLSRVARDSMNAAVARSNQHWNELADLNTMERMLGTIRPTQREYLGCLQGTADGRTIRIDAWMPASDRKQLQLAVAGSCDSVPRLVGTWHTHPYRADLQNLPIKERRLSAQDLQTFTGSPLSVTLVMWDQDSLDAAVRASGGRVVHPALVVVE
jgi:hypothetical protein